MAAEFVEEILQDDAAQLCRRQERTQGLQGIPADDENSKSVTVYELNIWELRSEFFPKPPDPEASFSNIRVMEENDCAGAEFGLPGNSFVQRVDA